MKNKKFDCVKMTRDIRDELYKKNKDKSLKDFADILVKESHKSHLWKSLNEILKAK
ncbi:MAG: hypothetical protein JXB50_15780 [Spirochaetes bacterium]|nr:hypothetical protein [Spirochaetota bacterium]